MAIPLNTIVTEDVTFRASSIFTGIDDIPVKFLTILNQYVFGFQLSTCFTVHFELPAFLTDDNIKNLGHNITGTTSKNIKTALINNTIFSDLGCILCKSVSLPGFGINTTGAQVDYRDFKGVPVGSNIRFDNRASFAFYDTHASFADFILRPWIALTSHYGLIARNPSDTLGNLINGLRIPITITQFSRSGSIVNPDSSITSESVKITKQIVLRNSCPIDLNTGLELVQDSKGEIILRRCDWVFQDYEITIPG